MNLGVGKHNRRFWLQRSWKYSLRLITCIGAAPLGEHKGK